MRQYVLITLSLLFYACSVDKPITLYATNMMYACECPRYRVFMVGDSRLNEIDLDTNKDLSNEIWRVINLEAPQKDSLIGVDLELEFESVEKEREFSKNEGVSPICNIYYFNGVLRQELFSKTTLYVKNYAIMPKSKNCISQRIE